MARFCDRLIYLRKKKGITQQELAEFLTKTGDRKISRSAVAMWELDKRVPQWEVLETIADFFNVDLDYLRGRDPSNLKLTQRQDDLIRLLENLPPEQQDDVIDRLESIVQLLISQTGSR